MEAKEMSLEGRKKRKDGRKDKKKSTIQLTENS